MPILIITREQRSTHSQELCHITFSLSVRLYDDHKHQKFQERRHPSFFHITFQILFRAFRTNYTYGISLNKTALCQT
uniref:Uncharacterized protein n=1 Tax=Escherichia coli TaxID=562 RepID=A0A220ITU5_ECOLX|nr:hypothetical protein [Escherichia coli]